ncbi:MAG: hypothetical protein RI907_3131, partial [Pseudomonadota bacterium]
MSLHASDKALKPALFADVPIGHKLLVNGCIPLLMFALFMGWQQWRLRDVGDNVSHAVRASVADAVAAKDLQRNVVQVQQFLSDISATRAQDGLDDGFKAAAEQRAQFEANLKAFRGRLDPADKAGLTRLDDLQARFQPYYDTGVRMAHAYVDGGPAEGNKLMPEFDKTSLALQEVLDAFVADETNHVESAIHQTEGNTSALLWGSLALCVGMCLFVASSNYVV